MIVILSILVLRVGCGIFIVLIPESSLSIDFPKISVRIDGQSILFLAHFLNPEL